MCTNTNTYIFVFLGLTLSLRRNLTFSSSFALTLTTQPLPPSHLLITTQERTYVGVENRRDKIALGRRGWKVRAEHQLHLEAAPLEGSLGCTEGEQEGKRRAKSGQSRARGQRGGGARVGAGTAVRERACKYKLEGEGQAEDW